MRNSIKKWVCIALAVLMLASSTAYAAPQQTDERQLYQNDEYIYEVLDNNTITILFYTGEDDIIQVPASIDGIPVKEIGSHAFYETQVKDVTVSEGITFIGSEAFYNCALETLRLPSTLKYAGTGAFRYCKSLRSVLIPPKAKLGDYMFYGCTSLSDVILPSDAQVIKEGMFAYCTSLKSIDFPEHVSQVDSYAFYGSGLTSLEFTNYLNYIGDMAFAQCRDLTSISSTSDAGLRTYVMKDAFKGSGVQFPDEWNSNKLPTVPVTPTAPGYTQTDPTEETTVGTSNDTPQYTTPQAPFEPTPDFTIAPTVCTEPITEAPETQAPVTQAPTESPTIAPTVDSTEPPTIPDSATSDEIITDDSFVTSYGFYIGDAQGFHLYEDECALSARDAIANNKKELLELAWNVRTQGDVNDDNAVNVKDATAIQKYCAGISQSVFIYKNADVNTDGKVNVKDATAVQKSIAGLVKI